MNRSHSDRDDHETAGGTGGRSHQVGLQCGAEAGLRALERKAVQTQEMAAAAFGYLLNAASALVESARSLFIPRSAAPVQLALAWPVEEFDRGCYVIRADARHAQDQDEKLSGHRREAKLSRSISPVIACPAHYVRTTRPWLTQMPTWAAAVSSAVVLRCRRSAPAQRRGEVACVGGADWCPPQARA